MGMIAKRSAPHPRHWALVGLLPALLACSLLSAPASPSPKPTAPPGATQVPAPSPSPGDTQPYVDVSGAGYQGVIVPAERAGEFGIFNATGYWTPTEADVAAFEAAFPAWIGQQTEWGADEVAGQLPDYIRQYVGFSRGDHALFYVNAFCPVDFIDWHSQPVMVDDGGPCFFRVVFDPLDGTFFELMINGLA